MDAEQITNIAIKIGAVQQKADMALWGAVIAAASAVMAAIVAGYFKIQLGKAQKEHEKQWAFIGKKTALIDAAIEIGVRMMYNKLVLVYHNDAQAAMNLFLLDKDGLSVESQFVVYGSFEIAEVFSDFRAAILSCPNNEFIKKWDEIYKKGQNTLLLCRKHLGIDVTEPFDQFSKKLQEAPPKEEVMPQVTSPTMGTISIQKL